MIIEEFIELSNAAQSKEELFELYVKELQLLGYDQIIYSFITDHKRCGIKAGHGVQNMFPQDWMNHYEESGYQALDPAVHYAFQTSQPFSWDYLKKLSFLKKKQTNILLEAEEAGLNTGVGIPLYGANGELAGVGLSSSNMLEIPDKNTLSRLKLITDQFHFAYCSIEPSPDVTDIPSLTARELEVLKWLARGKTYEDIADILSCSANNVNFHIKNIYVKLGANSKSLAVLKAIYFGIISVDVIHRNITD